MENDVAIFWYVIFICAFGLFSALKRISSSHGWIAVNLAILLVDVAGLLWERPAIIYAAGGMWLLLVLVPALIGRFYHRCFLQQDYAGARRLARMVSWFHPFDGWREMPEILQALEQAQRGEFAPAVETLKRFRGRKSLVGLAAICHLYRTTGQWEEFLVWEGLHQEEMERHPQLLQVQLRARGETGDLRGLVELYDRHKKQIARIVPATSRDLCRVMLFAFCGRPQEVERLFAGSLAILAPRTRGFWLATADWAAGQTERAKLQWEGLLSMADPPLRLAIERRLSRIAIPPQPLGENDLRVIADAANERGPDEHPGRRRRPA